MLYGSDRALCSTANSDGQCPLWVKSRHQRTFGQCPLYPQKRTLIERVCPLCAISGHHRELRRYRTLPFAALSCDSVHRGKGLKPAAPLRKQDANDGEDFRPDGARPVGRCRVETACPTDGALGPVLAESGGGLLMQRGAEKHRGD
jgi:hypothetical protein